MLGAMRKFSKSWVAVALIGLLIVAFGVWGVSDAFKRRPQTDVVARAGSATVKAKEFKVQFERIKKEQEQRAQRPISMEEVAAAGFDQQVLNMVGEMLAVSQTAKRLGLLVGKDLYEKVLRQEPSFFDPITGKFDPKTYQLLLAQNGVTPEEHRKNVSEEIAQQHLLRALGPGFEASRSHAAIQVAFAMQERDARYLMVDPSKVAKPAPPTDAQLQAFLKEVSAEAMRPEMRQLTIVRFSSKALAPTVQITPKEVQEVFDFRKDQLASVETRTVVQITAKNPAAAAAVADRLGKGEDPAAVAKSQGAQLVTYTERPKTAIADRKVADVAFSLPAGQTSGVIAGELGQAVVKVLAIKPGKTVTLEEVRPQIEQEARSRAAEAKISAMADKFEEAVSSGSSVVEAAKTIGLTAIATPPVTAQGQAMQAAQVTGLSPKLLETAFDLAQGADSELMQDQAGEYFVVHVDRVIPPALPTVEEVRAPLTQAYMARENQRRQKALADQLAERIRKGETIEAVAASIGAQTGAISGLNRMSAQREVATLGQGAVGALFGAKINEVVVAPAPGAIIVAKIEALHNGDAALVARMTNQFRNQISQQLISDYQGSIIRATRNATELKLFPENAKRALGIDPEAAPAKGKAG